MSERRLQLFWFHVWWHERESKYKICLFLLQFYNLPQNRSRKKYIKSSVAGIQDFRQSTV